MGINKFLIAGIIILILIMGVGIYEGINKPDLKIENFSYEYLSEINNETLADNLLIDVEPLEEPEDMFPNTNETHWSHMPLTYNYYNCSQTTIERIIKATEFITNRTESITFIFVKNQLEIPDISFICVEKRDIDISERYETLGGAVPYIYEDLNIYAPSEILIYPVTTCPYARPSLEIHEILHLLGLDHPKYADEENIMNPDFIKCNTDISEEDLEYLKSIYG